MSAMSKFTVSRIFANGDLVVRPGWVWGGCKGTRVRAMNPITGGLKAGFEIELRDGVSVVDECLVCDVKQLQAAETENVYSGSHPFGWTGSEYGSADFKEECACI
jgi:hypothetical protein